MAIDFPNTPTVGQIYTVGSRSWKWDGTIWSINANTPVLYRQDSPPSSPQQGDQWFETDTGRMFVYYGVAWVELGNATDIAGALQPGQITGLSAVTALTSDDVFAVVDNPSSAVATNKVTWGNVQSSITSTGTLGSLNVSGSVTSSTDYLLGTKSMPRGIVAYGQRISFQGATGTNAVFVTASTFTAVANRYYKITYVETECNMAPVAGAKDTITLRLNSATGTVLQTNFVYNPVALNTVSSTNLCWTGTLPAGSTVVVGTILTTNNHNYFASATAPAQITIEDIGII